MTHDPRPREQDVDNYMRELEALGFSDRVARSRDEAMVWQWQDEIRDQPTHEQLLNLITRVREDERGNRVYAAHNVMASEHANGYAKGRADAADAVAALLSWEESNSEVTFHVIDRDAAITAARGGTDE